MSLKCNFCKKSQHNVEKLIAGDNVSICNECIAECVNILDEEDVSIINNRRRIKKETIVFYKTTNKTIPVFDLFILRKNIIEEMNENIVRAESKYSGKTILTSGNVLKIGKEKTKYYVDIGVNNDINKIRVYINNSKDDVKKISGINIRDIVLFTIKDFECIDSSSEILIKVNGDIVGSNLIESEINSETIELLKKSSMYLMEPKSDKNESGLVVCIIYNNIESGVNV